MKGPFRNGDIVGVDHLGRQFLAVITDAKSTPLVIDPIPRNVNYFTVTKSEIYSHYPLRRGSRTPRVKSNGGLIYG